MFWAFLGLKKIVKKRKKMYSIWGDVEKKPGTKLLKIIVNYIAGIFIAKFFFFLIAAFIGALFVGGIITVTGELIKKAVS